MTSTEKLPVHVVVDKSGRQFIGRLRNKDETIELINPLLMIEQIKPSQVADSAEVMLNFSPVMNTFPVDNIELKWSSQFLAHENLERAYEDFWTQIRAARSGLSMARVVPESKQQEIARN